MNNPENYDALCSQEWYEEDDKQLYVVEFMKEHKLEKKMPAIYLAVSETNMSLEVLLNWCWRLRDDLWVLWYLMAYWYMGYADYYVKKWMDASWTEAIPYHEQFKEECTALQSLIDDELEYLCKYWE